MLAVKGGQSIGIGVPLAQVSIAVLGVVEGALADTEVSAAMLGEMDGPLGADIIAAVFVVLERLVALVVRF